MNHAMDLVRALVRLRNAVSRHYHDADIPSDVLQAFVATGMEKNMDESTLVVALMSPELLRDRLRTILVEMRDRDGRLLVQNPQLGQVVEAIATAIEEP